MTFIYMVIFNILRNYAKVNFYLHVHIVYILILGISEKRLETISMSEVN